MPGDTTDKMLAERGSRYGEYSTNAHVMQEMKDLFRSKAGWERLRAIHREALDMFALKLSRILVGDPEYRDNWDDIAGYARLTSARCHPPVGGGVGIPGTWDPSVPSDLGIGKPMQENHTAAAVNQQIAEQLAEEIRQRSERRVPRYDPPKNDTGGEW